MDPLNVFDYELLAKERMDPASWDFYAGGSDDEMTLRANQADFARIRLRPRVLVDVSQCDTSTSVLGLPVPMPLLVAPTSMHCLAHPEGECATAEARRSSWGTHGCQHGCDSSPRGNCSGRQRPALVPTLYVRLTRDRKRAGTARRGNWVSSDCADRRFPCDGQSRAK